MSYSKSLVLKMGLFEQLGPFFLFSQMVGLLPYRIRKNTLTGRFDTFTFNWFNKTTVYFILATSFQFFAPLTAYIMFQDEMYQQFNDNHLPVMFSILSRFASVVHYFVIILNRTITLRCYKLRSAVTYITNDVIRDLELFESIPGNRNTIKRRTFIGLFLILSMVTRFQFE